MKPILPDASPIPGLDRSESMEEWDIVNRLEERQKKNCGAIDARLSQFSTEFTCMIRRYNYLLKEIENTKVFWKSFTLRRQLKKLVKEMDINRDLRKFLYVERWKRT